MTAVMGTRVIRDRSRASPAKAAAGKAAPTAMVPAARWPSTSQGPTEIFARARTQTPPVSQSVMASLRRAAWVKRIPENRAADACSGS